MFENFNKVGSIEVLERKLKELEKPANKTGYWQKLSDECAKMSADQLKYVLSNDEVINAKCKVMEAFNSFLFEKFKDEFVEIEAFTKLCDEYQDIVTDIAKKYSDSIAQTLDENKELRAKIKELERKLNAKSDTKGA